MLLFNLHNKFNPNIYYYYNEVHFHSAKSRNAANALSRQLRCEQECLQFVSERFESDAWSSSFSRETVPYSRSLYGETAVAVLCPG